MAAENITNTMFENYMNSDKPTLVDFWAPWCGYCRRIGPAYDKIAQQYADEINIVKVNIDEEPALSDREKIEVIPTLVFYRDGRAVDSIVAPESKAMIEQFILQAKEK